MRKYCALLFLLLIVGCVVSFEDQLPKIEPGLTKKQVDEILQDPGKWVGTIDTETDGVRNVWGYPSSSYRPDHLFLRKIPKRYYLFFKDGKLEKHSEHFNYISSEPGINLPQGAAGPANNVGGAGMRIQTGSPGMGMPSGSSGMGRPFSGPFSSPSMTPATSPNPAPAQ